MTNKEQIENLEAGLQRNRIESGVFEPSLSPYMLYLPSLIYQSTWLEKIRREQDLDQLVETQLLAGQTCTIYLFFSACCLRFLCQVLFYFNHVFSSNTVAVVLEQNLVSAISSSTQITPKDHLTVESADPCFSIGCKAANAGNFHPLQACWLKIFQKLVQLSRFRDLLIKLCPRLEP
ncbi:uncharacterized protein LOC135147901 [Daucus carota subsp. sativus]|uniref:uncharacterized protein LOC135147901 n=1 Tax=Daucus carota subsp. sativus TaxID=79200 RepID=UPI003083349C